MNTELGWMAYINHCLRLWMYIQAYGILIDYGKEYDTCQEMNPGALL